MFRLQHFTEHFSCATAAAAATAAPTADDRPPRLAPPLRALFGALARNEAGGSNGSEARGSDSEVPAEVASSAELRAALAALDSKLTRSGFKPGEMEDACEALSLILDQVRPPVHHPCPCGRPHNI